MGMDRATSHLQAGSSDGVDFPPFTNSLPGNYVSSSTSNIQRNLGELTLADLLQLAKQLKYPSITTLRLFVSAEDQLSVAQFFGAGDRKTTDALLAFTRALTHAVEGWMQTLELGLSLGRRNINSLCLAIRSSRTLRHLSFANSGLGDVTLQVLSSCIQHCRPLQTLNLSGCALTDVSSAVITAIVKGVDPNARSVLRSPRKTSPAKHREPKFGQLWRQNEILIGKWSPAPDLGDGVITPRTEEDWQATLRKPMAVGVARHGVGRKPIDKSSNTGRLIALDLSCNSFTDALSEELCPLLYTRPPLRALNLRCNQMTRAGAKPLLDVMKEMNTLRLVDIRGNKDDSSLGVLENGEHYTTFSTFQSPFWMDPESLDFIVCDSTKSEESTPVDQSRIFTSSPPSSMPEKQAKATIISQHTLALKGGAGLLNLSPQNSANKTHAGTSRNNTPSKRNKIPSKFNNNTSPPRANICPSCSGASVSRTPAEHRGPSFRQKRNHCSGQGSADVHHENEGMTDFNDRDRRFISAPAKERPVSSARIKPLSSAWPENTTFFDQNSSKHISTSRDQDLDGRFMHSKTLEPAGEHPIWDNTALHEFDNRDIHGSSKVPDSLERRYNSNEGSRRAQSVGYTSHRPCYPRVYNNHHKFYGEFGHQNCHRSSSASEAPSIRPRWPSATYSQSRGRSPEKTPIVRCHHRRKQLNDVQSQKRGRSKALEELGHTPVFHQSLPGVASLPDDKKGLVEWNNFVNQMSTTLLNLKDGLDQLVGPTKGAVAQQAAAKLNQMPSSFFTSGMMRLLERSCKVLNSHVASLTRKHKETMQRLNGAENQAPIVDGGIPHKENVSMMSTSQEAVVPKQEKKSDKSQKILRH